MNNETPIVLPKIEHTAQDVEGLQGLIKIMVQFYSIHRKKPTEADVSEWMYDRLQKDLLQYGDAMWENVPPVMHDLKLIVRTRGGMIVKEDTTLFAYDEQKEFQRKWRG